MPYLDLAAIEATPLAPDPFDYMVVPGCIGVDRLEAANRDYPKITTPETRTWRPCNTARGSGT